MNKEYHIGIVTRNVEKASGKTTKEQTSQVSSKSLLGAVYFRAETLCDAEYPIPAKPSFMYASQNNAGWFSVPKVNDTILVMLDDDINNPDPRYICEAYTNQNIINRLFQKNYPLRLGLVTNEGHNLIFDDTKDNLQAWFEHNFGQRLIFEKDGTYRLQSRNVTTKDAKDETKDTVAPEVMEVIADRTNKKFTYKYQYDSSTFGYIEIDGTAKKITITDHYANIILIDTSGVKITDKSGNYVEMKAGDVKVYSVGTCNVEAIGKATIKADEIDLEGGTGTEGIVTKNCKCSFTGLAHPEASSKVKASKS